jgi:hypothetical protein
VTPGSIVKVTPFGTATGPVSLIVLWDCRQVVLALIIPLTVVSACTTLKTANKGAINTINRRAASGFFMLPSNGVFDLIVYGFLRVSLNRLTTNNIPTIPQTIANTITTCYEGENLIGTKKKV